MVYDALLDFRYSPGDATLRLIPKLEGRFAVVHPLFWAIGQRDGDRISIQIERTFGSTEPPAQTVGGTKNSVLHYGNGSKLKPTESCGVYQSFAVPQIRLVEGMTVRGRLCLLSFS